MTSSSPLNGSSRETTVLEQVSTALDGTAEDFPRRFQNRKSAAPFFGTCLRKN